MSNLSIKWDYCLDINAQFEIGHNFWQAKPLRIKHRSDAIQ